MVTRANVGSTDGASSRRAILIRELTLMTVVKPYKAECSECGHSEIRMGMMSFNSMVGVPEGLIEEHPLGCPKCGDVGFDVYEDEDEDD